MILHVKLVGEAGELLIDQIEKFNIQFDKEFIRLGIVFHDAGKIVYQNEIFEKGKNHETAGEKLLIENGINPKLARCCRSHGNWKSMDCSFEELIVALSDKLWKGKRESELEKQVVNKIAEIGKKDEWDTYVEMDSCFEEIASFGDQRLLRSRNI